MELSQLTPKLDMSVLAGVVVFVSLLYVAALYYSYGGLAKKQYAGLKKKGEL